MSNYKIINGELYKADDELYHYGVKGMKWGVRRVQIRDMKKLNKATRKYAKSGRKYAGYEKVYTLSDEGAKQNLSPTQYARWVTSGARQAQKQRLNQLKKVAMKDWKKYEKFFNEFNSKYQLHYDFVSDSYSIVQKRYSSPTGNSIIITR